MIDTAALKNRILALAMSGQVANNKKEVKLLFDCLCENAYKMDKNKVSDKNYDLSELPFEIPDNWKWVWLGDIFQHNTGKALNSSNTEGTYLEYITTSNLYWDRFELEELKTMLFKDSEIEKCTVRKGDLLICEGGDIGRSAIWSEDYEMRIQNHIHRLRPYVEDICVRFYYYVMMYYKNNGLISGRGIGLQGLSSKRLHSILVPLPDVETQLLIAEKIDELFSVIDTIDELQQQYSSDLEVLKSKIIDAGIQGKLTEQLPEDGTAEELLKQIAEEKKLLIKEKKIKATKATKALPEITEDEIPFEIPDNWKWTRLNDIGLWSAGATPSRRNMSYYSGCIPWVKTGELNNGVLKQTEEHISELALKECSVRLNPIGSVLIAMYGATIGKVSILDIEATTNQACCACIPYMGVHNKYLFYYLISHKEDFISKSHGGAQPNISKDIIINELIPLPPYEEQTRIADKLEELLGLI